MSEEVAIRLSNVGKMYKIFPTRTDTALEALGIARFMPWRRVAYQEFWALRGIDLELKRGSRLGIIGRNGAGKSTLLKLITQNVAPTEGQVEVRGAVQALMDAGAGFHPEFTGAENIRVSLTYQGFTATEVEAAICEIAEFTELGAFLSQPFKTYSAGMQARLGFATATALRPDILIVDEILGAGDAYFVAKSSERMKELVEASGATVLIVSHALDQVARYCDESIWIERGRIMTRGPSLSVINAYQEFVYRLEDRRLRSKPQAGVANYAAPDSATAALVVTLEVTGASGSSCDVSEIALLANDQPEEILNVGGARDVNPGYASMVSAAGSGWSDPRTEGGRCFRSLSLRSDATAVRGDVVFQSYMLLPDLQYRCRIRYRCTGAARVVVTIACAHQRPGRATVLPTGGSAWLEASMPVVRPKPSDSWRARPPAGAITPGNASPTDTASTSVRRWPSEGSIRIEKAILSGPDGKEGAVFEAGTALTVQMELRAHRAGRFNVVIGATLARLDGVLVTNLVSDSMPLTLSAKECRRVSVTLKPLLLGDGQYVFSLSIFEGTVLEETRYDLVARAYEFMVIGNPPAMSGAVFRQPATWSVEAPLSCADV